MSNGTEKRTETHACDTISRQKVIDALEKVAELFPWRVPGNRDSYDRYNEAWNDAIGRAEIEIEELPCVQPASYRQVTGKLDCISRQVAITAIQKAYADTEGGTDKCAVWKNVGLTNALHIMQDLPSAQPETAKRIVGKSRDGMTLWYQCDMCNEPVDAQDNFCRGCGRRLTDG